MRIVVLGYIVRGPMGGLAWHHLQYVLGLKAMGHKVLFLEDSDNYPACYHPDHFSFTTDPFYGLSFLSALFEQFDLQDHWSYFDAHTNQWFGANDKTAKSFCQAADVVINLSGMNPLRDWWQKIPVRLYIDTDPVFTQINHLTKPDRMTLAKGHTHFASFGENIGRADCLIPDDGFRWLPTRQPVFVNAWKVSAPVPTGKWTTVMQWDSYAPVEFNGRQFGMKSASFPDYVSIPVAVPSESFELALGGSTAPRTNLERMGWSITDSHQQTKTPKRYQEYISHAKGEWTVGKQGYIVANSGWFSERTLSYMASGKPVIVQDTGFTGFLPTGNGLFAFSTKAEVVAAIEKVNSDYSFHANAARKLVESCFDSQMVLKALLDSL